MHNILLLYTCQAIHLCSLMIAEEQRLDQNVFARLCIGLDGSEYL